LDNQNGQWQGVDALLELLIAIGGQEAVKLSRGPLQQLAILDTGPSHP
jgi:hypothetical protein